MGLAAQAARVFFGASAPLAVQRCLAIAWVQRTPRRAPWPRGGCSSGAWIGYPCYGSPLSWSCWGRESAVALKVQIIIPVFLVSN